MACSGSLRALALLLLAALALLPGRGTAAADITRGEAGRCDIQLTGVIREGDSERLQASLRGLERSDWIMLCLNSPGGDYLEALAMLDVVLKARPSVGTQIHRGARCFSACALLFLAGHYGKADVKPFRRLDALAQLGFHGPYISPDDAAYDPGVAAQAYQAGIQAIAQLLSLARDELFPQTLLMLALQKGSDEFLLIDTVGRAGQWNIDITGFKVVRKIDRRMVFQACANIAEWMAPGFSQPNTTPPTPVVFRQGIYRVRHPSFGDEGATTCVADVIELRTGGVLIDVQWDTGGNQASIRSPEALLRATEIKSRSPLGGPGRPLWMVYDRTLTLKEIAGPDSR